MSKACLIPLSEDLLFNLLGLENKGIVCFNAFVDYRTYPYGIINLVITGDGLPDTFEHKEGEALKKAYIEVRTKVIETEIKEY